MSDSITIEKRNKIQSKNDEFFDKIVEVIDQIGHMINSEEFSLTHHAKQIADNLSNEEEVKKHKMIYEKSKVKIEALEFSKKKLKDAVLRNKDLLIVTCD